MPRALIYFIGLVFSATAPAFTESEFSPIRGGRAVCDDARTRFSDWTEQDYDICQQIVLPTLSAIYFGKLSSGDYRVKKSNQARFANQYSLFQTLMEQSRLLIRDVLGERISDDPLFLSIPVEVSGRLRRIDFISQRMHFVAASNATHGAWYSLSLVGEPWTVPHHADREPINTVAHLVAQIKQLTTRQCPL